VIATVVQAGILCAAAACLGVPVVVGLLVAQKAREELSERLGKVDRS
jgi:hypothetical protein